MQISNIRKITDPLGRYFTAPEVSRLLVDSMGISNPKLVLDLGSGDGSLVGQAAKVWKKARFITVDVDKSAASSSLPNLNKSMFIHHVGDALDVSLDKRLNLNWGEADAAICNPPYIQLKWRKQFAEILEDAGLSHVLPRLSDAPADVLFIAQNLRFLRDNGRLGLILSDGIISGEKFANFRKELHRKHGIERVIELPRQIFKKTEAKAHIIVLSKNQNTDKEIIFQKLDFNDGLSEPYMISEFSDITRFDYSYLKNATNNNKRKIGTETVLITRGTYSSSEKKNKPYPILHTTDISLNDEFVHESFLVPPQLKLESTCVIAQAGDIIIGRVGRNLHKKVIMVRSGKVIISDCLLLLRVKEDNRYYIFKFLKSADGQRLLEAVSHGVCAKFITQQALLDIQF